MGDEARFRIAGPICTVLFSVIVMFTTINLMRDILCVLMESVPLHLDYNEIAFVLQQLSEVIQIKDLHVWSISMDKPALSAHLLVQSSTLENADGVNDVLRNAQNVLIDKFKIYHSTIQIEYVAYDGDDEDMASMGNIEMGVLGSSKSLHSDQIVMDVGCRL